MIDVYFCAECSDRIPEHFHGFVSICAHYFDSPTRCCPYIPISFPMTEQTRKALRNLRHLEEEGYVVTTEVMTDGVYRVLMKPLGFEEQLNNDGSKDHVFCLRKGKVHAPI